MHAKSMRHMLLVKKQENEQSLVTVQTKPVSTMYNCCDTCTPLHLTLEAWLPTAEGAQSHLPASHTPRISQPTKHSLVTYGGHTCYSLGEICDSHIPFPHIPALPWAPTASPNALSARPVTRVMASAPHHHCCNAHGCCSKSA